MCPSFLEGLGDPGVLPPSPTTYKGTLSSRLKSLAQEEQPSVWQWQGQQGGGHGKDWREGA